MTMQQRILGFGAFLLQYVVAVVRALELGTFRVGCSVFVSLWLLAGFYSMFVVGPCGKVNPRNLLSVDDQFG